MDVTLHLGAHRTASTTLQKFLRANRRALARAACEVWGPDRTRDGFFAGLFTHPENVTAQQERRIRRARGRISIALEAAEWAGLRQIVISEENMIGGFGDNFSTNCLYPHLIPRLGRFTGLFDEGRLRICLAVRSYDSYWASALSYSLYRGRPVPNPGDLDRLVTQPRRWQTIVQEVGDLFPHAEILVWPFEEFAGRPEQQLDFLMQGQPPPDLRQKRHWHNRAPSRDTLASILEDRGARVPDGLKEVSGRWPPFESSHLEALSAQYARDLVWLGSEAPDTVRFMPDAQAHARWVAEKEGQDDNGGIKRRVG